jgi:hypothetical protein
VIHVPGLAEEGINHTNQKKDMVYTHAVKMGSICCVAVESHVVCR